MKKIGNRSSTFLTIVVAAVVLAIATTSGAVAGSLVTSKKIKNNTIKSIDVRDNTLQSVDVRDGSLGKADLASAARGFTSIVTKRVQGSTVADGANSSRSVACDAGQVAIGGGAYVTPGGVIFLGGTGGIVLASHPRVVTNFPINGSTGAAGNGVAPTHWYTEVQNDQGEEETAFHYAICASK